MVVITFFIVGTALFGIQFTFGVFFKSIESEFVLTRAFTSSINSVSMLLAGFIAFGGGLAIDRYGPRIVILFMGIFTGLSLLLTSQTSSPWQLFITYSLLLSLGIGPTFVVITSTVSRWFDKRRGLALGIAGAGSGLGTVIMAPLAAYLIVRFDWRISYIVLGIITWLVAIPLSRLLKKDPHEIGTVPDGINIQANNEIDKDRLRPVDLSASQVFGTRNFWILAFVWVFLASSGFFIFVHFVPHITDMGFSTSEAAVGLGLIGLSSFGSRILVGAISDRIGRKLTALICALIQFGNMLWLLWAHDLWMLYLFAIVFGFAYSGLTTAISALIGDVFGIRNIGSIIGMLEIGFGIGAATGPFIAGVIYDASGSYFVAFLVFAGALLLKTFLITLIRQEKKPGSS
jgi:MFS family permease